ncbi:MAG TPA: F0F1 ATP synthase subunit delta [Clostridia bacterium]|nr:F0F1 ATP synthase subunit delta [Clostridia bacterium]
MALKGELYVAGPFGEEQLAIVQARFSRLLGAEVAFEVTRDESLIGGFLALVDGKAYDASVSSRMKDVRRFLVAKD